MRTENSPVPVMQVVESGAGLMIKNSAAQQLSVGEAFELYQHPIAQQPNTYLSEPAVAYLNGDVVFVIDEIAPYVGDYSVLRGVYELSGFDGELTQLIQVMHEASIIDGSPMKSGTFNGLALVPLKDELVNDEGDIEDLGGQ